MQLWLKVGIMSATQKGKQLQLCSYYAPEVVGQLKRLSEATRVPLAVYMREAAEDLLKKYAAALRKAGK